MSEANGKIAKNQAKRKGGILPVFAVVALLLITLWTLYFYAHLDAVTPTDEDWKRAAEAISAQFQPGDFVVIKPHWATLGERFFVERNLPYQHVRWIEKEHWTGKKRLWILTAYERTYDKAAFMERTKAAHEATIKLAPFLIERFRLPAMTNGYDFRANLHEAEVFIRRGKMDTDCGKWDERLKRFHCSKRNDWQYIGQLKKEIEDAVRPVIWAHPITHAAIHIRYYRVSAKRRISIGHALTAYAAQDPNGKPVFIEVFVDGEQAGRVIQENKPGWFVDTIFIERFEGELHDIEFVITTPFDGRRHFIFNAYAD